MRNNILLFLFLLINISLHGQEYLLDIENITSENGLANMHTFATHKDSKGFLWISTKYGLNRYDGYEFKLFTKEKNGLFRNNPIFRIEEDEEGNLLLFYIHGGIKRDLVAIDIFNPNTEKATPINDHISGDLPFEISEVLCPQTKKNQTKIWIYDLKGQVFYYDNKSFKKFFENTGKAINVVTETENKILVGSENELIHLDLDGNVLKKELMSDPIHQIWATDTTLWLQTTKRTYTAASFVIFNYTIWKKASQDSDFEVFPFADSNFLKNRTIGYLHRDQNGLWYLSGRIREFDIPTFNIFDPSGNKIFELNNELPSDVLPESVGLLETSDNLWINSNTGLIKLKVSKKPFQVIHTIKGFSDTRGITEDEAGNIYFLNGPIFQYHTTSGKVQKLSTNNGTYNLVYCDSFLLAGIYSRNKLGLKFNLKTGKEVLSPSWEGDTPTFSSMKTEQPGLYFFGNLEGLSYFDANKNEGRPFQNYNEFEELKNHPVYHFHQNKSGIWLATENGIYLMKEGQGIVQRFGQETGDLPFNHIRHISESPAGVFWLATSGGGIIKWKPNIDTKQEAEFRQFTTKESLSNNYTYAVYPDDFGNLWIPSDKGLMQMNASTFQVKTYLVEDGLPHNEFNISSHYQAKDEKLYFGGLGGLISFHPKDFPKNMEHQSDLIFTNLKIWEDGKEKATDKTNLLNEEKEVTIKPTDRLLELKFALLDFDKPENHSYSYQIEGYDDRSHFLQENLLRITNLPYGDYSLKITGQNINKGWTKKQLTIPIHVLKPFYLQWWFIALMILATIGFVIFYIFRREHLLRKEQERLEREVKNRTQTIQKQSEDLKALDKAKTQFFSNITHEFRTPLTLILGPSEQLAQDNLATPLNRSKASGINKNAQHLLSLINQILDISKIESKQMQIEITRGDLVRFTKKQTESFKDLAEKRNQTFNFICTSSNWETNFDKKKWLKIVFNLISNALKFTGESGFVNVFLEKGKIGEEEAIQLRVEDTGIGIPPEQLDRIFDRFYQTNESNTRTQEGTGIGLALVKELVELLGGTVSLSSKVGEGTCFKVLLPVLDAKAQTSSTISPIEGILEHSISIKELEPASVEQVVMNSAKLDLLLIEDNEEIRSYIKSCLDLEKYNIIEAVNGEEGIQKAQEFIPDLIVSDIMMPKKDGYEVIETIRENITTSHIPLVLLTAKSSLESRLQGLQRGADAYLTKPFSPEELALRIEKLIEIRQNLQARYQTKEKPKEDKKLKKEDAFITRVRTYIIENIDETSLNGEMIGAHFNMSRMHLHRKLKALTNQSASEMIKEIRLNKAMEYLTDENNDLNISEITYKTGFSNISHFSKTFKKTFGKSPSEVKRE